MLQASQMSQNDRLYVQRVYTREGFQPSDLQVSLFGWRASVCMKAECGPSVRVPRLGSRHELHAANMAASHLDGPTLLPDDHARDTYLLSWNGQEGESLSLRHTVK
jgi:hypothetical protein